MTLRSRSVVLTLTLTSWLLGAGLLLAVTAGCRGAGGSGGDGGADGGGAGYGDGSLADEGGGADTEDADDAGTADEGGLAVDEGEGDPYAADPPARPAPRGRTSGRYDEFAEEDEDEPGAGGPLVPLSKTKIKDLPVPVGFKLDQSTSRSYTSRGGRIIDMTYNGKAATGDVERFYRHHMPMRDWRYIGSQLSEGRTELRFTKGDELAEVTIRSKRALFGRVAEVRFNVQTLGPADE